MATDEPAAAGQTVTSAPAPPAAVTSPPPPPAVTSAGGGGSGGESVTGRAVSSPRDDRPDMAFMDDSDTPPAVDTDADDCGTEPVTMPTPTPATMPPLRSALKRGAPRRRRLQVVINESKNTYCEASYGGGGDGDDEDAPQLVSVRAFSLLLPELLSFEPAVGLVDAVSLSPPDAYRDIISAGHLCEETVVDDSESSECSTDGVDVPVGPAPLAEPDDLALSSPSSDDVATDDPDSGDDRAAGADEPRPSCSTDGSPAAEEVSRACPFSAASWRNLPDLVTDGAPDDGTSDSSPPPPPEQSKTSPLPPPEPSKTSWPPSPVTVPALIEPPSPVTVPALIEPPSPVTVPALIEPPLPASGVSAPPSEPSPSPPLPPASSTPTLAPAQSSPTPAPEPASSTSPAAAPSASPEPVSPEAAAELAAAAAAAGCPPPQAVLTIANVQQHDKVIEIEDSRAQVMLSGILKGGRLWGGVRSVDSDDSDVSQQRRSVRFEASPCQRVLHLEKPSVTMSAAAAALLEPARPPGSAESDGDSSLSSMDTVIAMTADHATEAGVTSGQQVVPPARADETTGGECSDVSDSSGDSTASDSTLIRLRGRQLEISELAGAVVCGRSSGQVARAIEHNALRRSLARGGGGGDARVRVASQRGGSYGLSGTLAALALSGAGDGRPPTPERRLGPAVRTASSSAVEPLSPRPLLFSPPPPDIQVPGDVREWKMSERMWPKESPLPTRRQPQPARRPLDRLDTLLATDRLSPARPDPAGSSCPAQPDPAGAASPTRSDAVEAATPAGRPHPEPRRRLLESSDRLGPPARPAGGRLAQEPPTAAGDRDSAASSADSRDSYSLDDIDAALGGEPTADSSEPSWSSRPPAAKEGSADSGYDGGSSDGRAAAEPADGQSEPDELAAFAEMQAARTERLRKRYHSQPEEPGCPRRPSVRTGKPRFEATSEILRQMQRQLQPQWARAREQRLAEARRLPALHETRPATALGASSAPPCRAERARYASAQHLPQAGDERLRRPASAHEPAAPLSRDQWLRLSGGRPAAPLPHGYVYPQYQPPLGPPLPPRQGQVRPTGPMVNGSTAAATYGHRVQYQSTPNLYMPQQEARRPPPQHPHYQQQPLPPSPDAYFTRRSDPGQYASVQERCQPRREGAPPLAAHQPHQTGWSGHYRPADLPPPGGPWLDGAPSQAPRAPLAHKGGEWRPKLGHTRPFSSSDIYPQVRETYANNFSPQPYMHDI